MFHIAFVAILAETWVSSRLIYFVCLFECVVSSEMFGEST